MKEGKDLGRNYTVYGIQKNESLLRFLSFPNEPLVFRRSGAREGQSLYNDSSPPLFSHIRDLYQILETNILNQELAKI
jgi:hypothetical protein